MRVHWGFTSMETDIGMDIGMDIEARQREVADEFAEMDDWMDRYQLLIDMGTQLPPLPPESKTESNLIEGCQSRVWLTATLREGRVYYEAESDALIVRGIAAVVIGVLTGLPPADILSADLHFIDDIGLRDHLSPTRSNGLAAMLRQMKLYALAFESQAHTPTSPEGVATQGREPEAE